MSIFTILIALFPNLMKWIGAFSARLIQLLLSDVLYAFDGVFNDNSVRSYFYFLTSWGGVMFIIGVGLALAEFAASYNEGNGTDVKGTLKNIAVGLFASFGVVNIPILLFRFTIEATNSLIGGSISSALEGQNFQSLIEFRALENTTPEGVIESSGETVMTASGGWFIGSIFCIVMFVFIVKIMLGNFKRSGILIVLLTICPIHLLSIPRGYTDGFYSWCKQVVGQCVTFFVQNFLLALSILVFANSGSLSLRNFLITLGILLASSEAPRILQQFGLESSVRSNATQAIYAVSGITNIVRSF